MQAIVWYLLSDSEQTSDENIDNNQTIELSNIDHSTTLADRNTNYILTSDIQIAEGAILTVDSGVAIDGNGHHMDVFGTLKVEGTENERVQINNLLIGPGESNAIIEINYAELEGVDVYNTHLYGYGSLILRNSVLSNMHDIYLWYPNRDCYIEKNIFLNSGGISTGTSENVKVYIRNNYFYGSTGDGYGEQFAVQNWTSYSTSETIVEYNSFVSTDRVAVMLPVGYDGSSLSALNNYWGTVDEAEINQMIFDANDDLGVSGGVIPYDPFLTEHHPLTPIPDSLTLEQDESNTSSPTPLKKTGQTTSYYPGDDGDLQKGVDHNYTRDDVTETVTDHVTGLMWQDDVAVASVKKQWVTQANYDAGNYGDTSGDTATSYCASLTLGGYSDWRLPTIQELVGITDYSLDKSYAIDTTVFQNLTSDSWKFYWTSTSSNNSRVVWTMEFDSWRTTAWYKNAFYNMRCVRDGN